jgi:hypothetical protein
MHDGGEWRVGVDELSQRAQLQDRRLRQATDHRRQLDRGRRLQRIGGRRGHLNEDRFIVTAPLPASVA